MYGRALKACRTFWSPAGHFSQLMTGKYYVLCQTFSFLSYRTSSVCWTLPDKMSGNIAALCRTSVKSAGHVRHTSRGLRFEPAIHLGHSATHLWSPAMSFTVSSVAKKNPGRGRNFCLQKFLTGLAGLVYLLVIFVQSEFWSIQGWDWPDVKLAKMHRNLLQL